MQFRACGTRALWLVLASPGLLVAGVHAALAAEVTRHVVPTGLPPTASHEVPDPSSEPPWQGTIRVTPDAAEIYHAIHGGPSLIPGRPAYDGPADIVVLEGGVYDFGTAPETRSTVPLRRPVVLKGEVVTDPSTRRVVDHATTILGGGRIGRSHLFSCGSERAEFEGGAFYVLVDPGVHDRPVVFDGIRFSDWAGVAIATEGGPGLEARRCAFERPVPSRPNCLLNGARLAYGILTSGPLSVGELVVTDNVARLGGYAERNLPGADDEAFVHPSFSSYRRIELTGNEIEGIDDGLKVTWHGLFAAGDFSASISIRDNTLHLDHAPESTLWPGRGAITVLGSTRIADASIMNNDMTVLGNGTAITISGMNFVVSKNRVYQGPNADGYPVCPLAIGYNQSRLGFSLGASLHDSVVSDNRFAGQALFGIVFLDVNFQPPYVESELNTSSDNVFMGNDLEDLATPAGFTLVLFGGTHDNVLKGHFAKVLDLGQNNRITGYDERVGGIGPQVSEALARLRF